MTPAQGTRAPVNGAHFIQSGELRPAFSENRIYAKILNCRRIAESLIGKGKRKVVCLFGIINRKNHRRGRSKNNRTPSTITSIDSNVIAGGKRGRFRRFRSEPVSHLRMVQREPVGGDAVRTLNQSQYCACDRIPGAQLFQIQNSGSRVHFYLFKLHRIGGLVAGSSLLILGVSGSVIAFSGEIDRLLHPSLFRVVPQGQPLPLGQLASSAASVLHPGESIEICLPSTRADVSYSFIAFGGQIQTWDEFKAKHYPIPRQIFVDQYTGRVPGSLSVVRFTQIMRALHLIPVVMGCSSVILVLLVLSGLYLWWPRKRIKIGLSGSVQRLSFDLHNAIGLFASLFLFLFAITGTYMAFEFWPVPLSYAITHSKPVTQPAFSMPQVGLKPVSLDLVATAAKDTLPGATVLGIVIPRKPREAYLAKMRFTEDRSDNGGSTVWIDQFCVKVLAVASSRTAPLGNKIQNVNRLIHTGAVFGNGGRAFGALVALILVLQTVTGLQLWWNGRRRKAPRVSASEP